jgi:hypothetical protein
LRNNRNSPHSICDLIVRANIDWLPHATRHAVGSLRKECTSSRPVGVPAILGFYNRRREDLR